ncbi:uncharacterized protein EI90DRAFT_920791 [Cantharellus anzutake]|uniref:uncharacterized protein n=1 Tax=Cantharellus anzutake TaxID=1750568 RepID=UPI0019043D63|nr:uncharacterized protein EI90DRAFT_920791 [Cantharellus anzutake]KAF8332069.1 hypothetical protein EI90DRAFT_920791 [Cantharellus anzutake]
MINPPSKSRTPSALKIVTHRASLKWHPYTSDRGSSWNKLSSGIHSFNSLLPNGASSSFSSNPSQRALPRGRGKGRGRHKKSIQGISSPNPSTSPVHFPVNDCKETPSPRPQTLLDPASDDDNSQQEYIPRAKLTLACANEPYAKDLVAQCVAMIQEIYLLPPDPPLPPGVYLPGHTPPLSPIHPQPQQHPLAAQPHGQALIAARRMIAVKMTQKKMTVIQPHPIPIQARYNNRFIPTPLLPSPRHSKLPHLLRTCCTSSMKCFAGPALPALRWKSQCVILARFVWQSARYWPKEKSCNVISD